MLSYATALGHLSMLLRAVIRSPHCHIARSSWHDVPVVIGSVNWMSLLVLILRNTPRRRNCGAEQAPFARRQALTYTSSTLISSRLLPQSRIVGTKVSRIHVALPDSPQNGGWTGPGCRARHSFDHHLYCLCHPCLCPSVEIFLVRCVTLHIYHREQYRHSHLLAGKPAVGFQPAKHPSIMWERIGVGVAVRVRPSQTV